jgi:PAS domain S-box-containing protein
MDSLLDTAPCGYLSFADDGTIRTVNQTLLDLLGLERTALVGRSIESILSPGARIFYQTHLFPLLRVEKRVEEVYLSLRTPDGDDLTCLFNARRTERADATVNEAVLLRFEERNQYEDEILQAKQAAEQANRAKDKFLSTVSHELRTPISTIKSLSQYLAMGVKGPVTDEQKDYLTRIESAADYLDTLINDILDFARLEAGSVDVTLGSVRVRDLLERAEALVEVRFQEADLTYERPACPSDLYVRADPDRLQQILLNLLTNAIKFTPADGTVSVDVDATDAAVQIRVADTGVGIPKEEQAHIFDPFVQAGPGADAEASDGVGLGLAISRDLAEAMNGSLSVDSEAGTGTTFTLSLAPAAAPPSVSSAE